MSPCTARIFTPTRSYPKPQPVSNSYRFKPRAGIRDIRFSEKRFHQKIRDIYSLSADYNPALQSTQEFSATVQNKRLYAVTGQTAAELISARADAARENMRLRNYKGAGQVSRDQIERKVLQEYAAYHARQLKLPEIAEKQEWPQKETVERRMDDGTTNNIQFCFRGGSEAPTDSHR